VQNGGRKSCRCFVWQFGDIAVVVSYAHFLPMESSPDFFRSSGVIAMRNFASALNVRTNQPSYRPISPFLAQGVL